MNNQPSTLTEIVFKILVRNFIYKTKICQRDMQAKRFIK